MTIAHAALAQTGELGSRKAEVGGSTPPRRAIEIGSSDAPIILGVSPYTTPWQLWAQRVGLIEDKDVPDEVMRAGTALEPAVLGMVFDDLGVKDGALRAPLTRWWSQDRRWLRATPDAVLYDEYGEARQVIELKCQATAPPSAPRIDHVVQCLHHLLVYEWVDSCLLVYFGALRMARFTIPRHQGALDRVLREEEHFLRLIETETPPPVSAADASILWRAWPLVKDETVMLPVEAYDWHRAMADAERRMDAATAEYEEARAKIKAAMGARTVAMLPDRSVRYTWRQQKDGKRPLRWTAREEA